MKKKLKKMIINHNEEMRAAFPRLYDEKWVEDAADKGWKQTLDSMKKNLPGFSVLAENRHAMNIFAIFYYSSFEHALNTFFGQCLEDSMTQIELIIDEFHKAKASFRKETQDFTGTKPGV